MRRFGWLTLAALFAVSAGGQTPAPTSTQPPSQTFHTATVVVEVDAMVTDAKGQFVTNLATDDFDVLEDGKPQRVQRIYVVTGRTVTVPPEPTASRPGDVSTLLAPAPAAAPQRVFVLLFDQDHLQEGAFKRL
jgi:hypothetical protein